VPKGGKRPGAGRKKGSITKATVYRQEMQARAVADGISPLDVMVTAMRQAWEKGDIKEAVSHAEKAAPYVHNRLAAVEHSGDKDNPVSFLVASGVPTADDDDQWPASSSH
jgi:hypothetical protein